MVISTKNLGQVLQYEHSGSQKEMMGLVSVKELQQGVYSVFLEYGKRFVTNRLIVVRE